MKEPPRRWWSASLKCAVALRGGKLRPSAARPIQEQTRTVDQFFGEGGGLKREGLSIYFAAHIISGRGGVTLGRGVQDTSRVAKGTFLDSRIGVGCLVLAAETQVSHSRTFWHAFAVGPEVGGFCTKSHHQSSASQIIVPCAPALHLPAQRPNTRPFTSTQPRPKTT